MADGDGLNSKVALMAYAHVRVMGAHVLAGITSLMINPRPPGTHLYREVIPMMTDAPHKPSPDELFDLFRDIHQTSPKAAVHVVESAALIQQRIISLFQRGAMSDDGLILYYRRGHASGWDELSDEQVKFHRIMLTNAGYLLPVILPGRKPDAPTGWALAR